MSDIKFETNLRWNGIGRDGEGEVTLDEQKIKFSSPSEMGGKGIGTSPEDLLISAVSTCYIGTLYAILAKKKLPVQHVEVQAEGVVTGYPLNTNFEHLMVHPTIIGGDESMVDDYEKSAAKAKDKCFIGKSIAGNIDYQVGNVDIRKE